MNISISENAQILGAKAAHLTAKKLNEAIERQGEARLVLSTGASQFTTLEALIQEDVDWSKVEMFHLDEYMGISEEHPASFCRYLKERFVSKVPLKQAHYVHGDRDMEETLKELTAQIREKPLDVGLIGIGENAHIAFNDPPADFDTDQAYIVVDLDEKCKNQQVREGWFENIDSVPKQAVTMAVKQILKCKSIISSVPYQVKAQAICDLMQTPVSNLVPGTVLKQHQDFHLFLDKDSASLIYK